MTYLGSSAVEATNAQADKMVGSGVGDTVEYLEECMDPEDLIQD